MSKLRVLSFAVSLDGFSAGVDQELEHPLGVRGPELMEWFFPTRMFQRMYGSGEGETGIDNGFAERGFDNLGAWILGRNMFGPVRGPWPDESWRGWWGDEPPFRVPVFVLTHTRRPPIAFDNGTVFHFVETTPEDAVRMAVAASDGKDVRIGGGATTARDFLRAGLVDDLHVAVVPIILGRGERLWDDLRGLEADRDVVSETAESGVVHVTFTRR